MEANKKIAVAVTWLIVLIHVMFGNGLSLSLQHMYIIRMLLCGFCFLIGPYILRIKQYIYNLMPWKWETPQLDP